MLVFHLYLQIVFVSTEKYGPKRDRERERERVNIKIKTIMNKDQVVKRPNKVQLQ